MGYSLCIAAIFGHFQNALILLILAVFWCQYGDFGHVLSLFVCVQGFEDLVIGDTELVGKGLASKEPVAVAAGTTVALVNLYNYRQGSLVFQHGAEEVFAVTWAIHRKN